MLSKQTASINFEANEGAIELAHQAVSRFASDARLSHDAMLRLNLVIEELLSNTLMHGLVCPGSMVALRMRRVRDTVTVLYVDEGVGFDPTAYEAEDTEAAADAVSGAHGASRRPKGANRLSLMGEDTFTSILERVDLGGQGLPIIAAYALDARYRRTQGQNVTRLRLPCDF